MLRIAVALFLVTLAFFAAAERLGIAIPVSLDEAIRRDLDERATAEELDKRTLAALKRGDVSEARSFVDLAASLGRPLPDGTMRQVLDEEGPAHTAMRNTGRFIAGFATGSGEGAAGLAGSVVSDFTVVGDLRDIAREGTKMMSGEPYSTFLLGLSAVGIAATAATVASGGGGAPVRFGASILKAAWHGGEITAGLAASLGRLLGRAVDFAAIGEIARGLDITSSRAIRQAAADIAKNVRPQVFARVAGDVVDVQRAVGVGDTVKLLRYVRSTGELSALPAFAARFGVRSRAVASFMGAATLRAFKTTVRVAQFLVSSLQAVILWFAGLAFTMLLGASRRAVRWLVRATPPHRKAADPLPDLG